VTIEVDPDVLVQIADLHAVYRMFDGADRLLYVGTTGRARRFDEHGVKRWFPAVRRITLDWHATEADARKAERIAIRTEEPRYNIAGAPPPGQGILAGIQGAPERDVLADMLAAFGDASCLHWAVLASRLARRYPDRWADATKETVSAQCRALGVRSVDVRMGSVVVKGCRRADIKTASVRRLTMSLEG
jgi:hypothetical protein